jgi:hypothetical protein
MDARSAPDFGKSGKEIKGCVTSNEVSSLVNPLEVTPGCLAGDVDCIGWNMSRAIAIPSRRLLIALRASPGSEDRRRLMSADSRMPEAATDVSG